MNHTERKHSKFSASGSERWLACPGSVELSETQPRKDSVWSLEGTKAHEVLEWILRAMIDRPVEFARGRIVNTVQGSNAEMYRLGFQAASFIYGLYRKTPASEIMVETRVHVPEIHEDAFGTFDGAVVDHFGTLHIFDYKYGAGVAVSPIENLQMIFYAIGVASRFHWNFKRVRVWIIQPRIKGYDGPVFWELSILELKAYVKVFRAGVKRVLENPDKYVEGSHCHWCPGKRACPLKQQIRDEAALSVFTSVQS